MIIPSSGTPGNPITYDVYGTGNIPVISGSEEITGWTPYSGSIYVANVSTGTFSSMSQVFVDGVSYDVSHYPNTGYNTITATSSDRVSLTDAGITATGGQLIGADIYIRSVPWRIESRAITGYNSGTHTVSWGSAASYAITAGYGYYFARKLWMLDQPTEWYYDSSLGKLYIWLEGNEDPSIHTIETSNKNDGITINNKSYITIRNISISQLKNTGIYMINPYGIILSNLDISNNGSYGIYTFGGASGDNMITNNTIRNNINGGITVSNGTSNPLSFISNNIIDNTGYKKINSIAGIHLSEVSNYTVSNNSVTNNGYNGIHLQGGNNNTIQNNRIDDSCLILDDCASIYIRGNSGVTSTGNQIIGNIVSDSIGNFSGTVYTSTQAE